GRPWLFGAGIEIRSGSVMASGLRERAGAAHLPGAASSPGRVPFIDGLRAIAIVIVVGYHVALPGLSGGFVGVDVFLVISGYLIIGQIRAEVVEGRFSFIV